MRPAFLRVASAGWAVSTSASWRPPSVVSLGPNPQAGHFRRQVYPGNMKGS